MTEIKTKDVTAFLDFMIRTATMGVCAPDDDGYISRGGEKVVRGAPPRPILLYQEKVSDEEALVLNPFAEGIKENAAVRWFYNALWQGLAGRVLQLMASVVQRAVLEQAYAEVKGAAKRKAFEKEHPDVLVSTPPAFRTLVMSIIDVADDRMVEELEIFIAHVKELGRSDQLFLCILYLRKMLASAVDVPLITDPEFQPPKKIRKASFQAFRTLIMAIFDVKEPRDLNAFRATARDDASSKLDSQVLCFFNVLKHINPALDHASPDLSVDLDALKVHLDRIPAYSANAKGVIFSLAPPKPADTLDRIRPDAGPGMALPVGTSRIDEALGIRPGTVPAMPSVGFPVMETRPAFGAPAGPFDHGGHFARPSFGTPGRSIPITSGRPGAFGPGLGDRGISGVLYP